MSDYKEELHELGEELKQARDELRVEMHLAKLSLALSLRPGHDN